MLIMIYQTFAGDTIICIVMEKLDKYFRLIGNKPSSLWLFYLYLMYVTAPSQVSSSYQNVFIRLSEIRRSNKLVEIDVSENC